VVDTIEDLDIKIIGYAVRRRNHRLGTLTFLDDSGRPTDDANKIAWTALAAGRERMREWAQAEAIEHPGVYYDVVALLDVPIPTRPEDGQRWQMIAIDLPGEPLYQV
jgi:hypothetical protein